MTQTTDALARYYAKTKLCGAYDGVCVRPKGHAGPCANPPEPKDLRHACTCELALSVEKVGA